MEPKLVRWVLAHEPIEIFIRAAEEFARIIEARAPGRLNIDILTLSEYADKYNDGKKVTKGQLLDLMAAGKIEMSQMYTYVLSKYNRDLDVLDLPFLFRDHDHAAKVFEGPIGEELLQGYSRDNSKIRGMAFTYSGGYKNMTFNRDVTALTDFVGAKIRTSNSPVAQATFRSLGAVPTTFEIEELAQRLGTDEIDAGECTWPRFYSNGVYKNTKTVVNTDHSLLLTNIIINTDFFAELDGELQSIVRDAAIQAARFERQISVDDVEPTSNRAIADGIKVVNLNTREREQFVEATKDVYKQFENYFSPGLVDSIQKS
jgi:TRAP-type C4-dicarboxylate transport system substrate-binding protein